MNDNENIKNWLKDKKLTREWLAEKTLSSKSTVDGWLSNNKFIPEAKLALIAKLMQGDDTMEITIPSDFEDFIRARAEELQQSINQFVIDILEKTRTMKKDDE